MSKQKFAFDKTNFILLAVGMAVVILGFILMTGPVSFSKGNVMSATSFIQRFCHPRSAQYGLQAGQWHRYV